LGLALVLAEFLGPGMAGGLKQIAPDTQN